MAAEKVKEKLNGWNEDKEEVLKIIRRNFNGERNQITLNLLGTDGRNSPTSSSSSRSETVDSDLLGLAQSHCVHSRLYNCLDFKPKEMHYLKSDGEAEVLSRKKNLKFSSTKKDEVSVDLKLKLSNQKLFKGSRKKNNIAEGVQSGLRLVGCYTCLMYFMVPTKDFNCPRCKGSFLVDFSSSCK